LLGLFDPEDGSHMFLRNACYNGLYSVISQKIVFYITTGVRTSNPKEASVRKFFKVRSTTL
jgi:hypothetical protein